MTPKVGQFYRNAFGAILELARESEQLLTFVLWDRTADQRPFQIDGVNPIEINKNDWHNWRRLNQVEAIPDPRTPHPVKPRANTWAVPGTRLLMIELGIGWPFETDPTDDEIRKLVELTTNFMNGVLPKLRN